MALKRLVARATRSIAVPASVRSAGSFARARVANVVEAGPRRPRAELGDLGGAVRRDGSRLRAPHFAPSVRAMSFAKSPTPRAERLEEVRRFTEPAVVPDPSEPLERAEGLRVRDVTLEDRAVNRRWPVD